MLQGTEKDNRTDNMARQLGLDMLLSQGSYVSYAVAVEAGASSRLGMNKQPWKHMPWQTDDASVCLCTQVPPGRTLAKHTHPIPIARPMGFLISCPD
jgi:hypothetical protein